MVVELTVTIKDEERKLTKDFIIYEPITLEETDPIISQCIRDVREEFRGEPDNIKIKAMMILR